MSAKQLADFEAFEQRQASAAADLEAVFDCVLGGALVSSEEVIAAARTYIAVSWGKIRNEEGRLFPLAEKHLSQSDWTAILGQNGATASNTGRWTLRDRLRALHDSIARRAECGCSPQLA